MTIEQAIEWVVDVEGVHVCSECWDDEMRASWPRTEPYDGMYCESCSRYVGDEMPEWMERAQERAAAERLAEALREIVGWGVKSDAKATHSTRVVARAREALEAWEGRTR